MGVAFDLSCLQFRTIIVVVCFDWGLLLCTCPGSVGLATCDCCLCTRGHFRTLFCGVSDFALGGWVGGGEGDNNVRVPNASDNQSMHARTILTFVFPEHTVPRASMPKP